MELNTQSLGCGWDVYHRDPQSRDWSFQSYEKIMEINTYGELRAFLHLIPEEKIKKGHISIMRHGIKPIYEDPSNTNGGAWTLKLREDILPEYWKYYVTYTMVESLLTEQSKQRKPLDRINGIVLCPRRGFSVLQIWTNKDGLEYEDFNHKETVTSSSILFRKHQN
jgi:hypothetical protein